VFFFFFSSRRRHTRSDRDWSSDVCSSDLSLLPPEAIARLLSELTSPRRTPHAEREVTIEANPEDVTVDSARSWKAAGINRVSLRSEERRVGKECRSRWWTHDERKKEN